MENFAIIIPSFEPDGKLLQLVNDIHKDLELSNFLLLIVNDGSGEEYQQVFNSIEKNVNLIILNHSKNKGKGAALKTAFKYLSNNFPNIIGAVTIDSDGQHTVKDMLSCVTKFLEKIAEFPIILGSRNFNGSVPFRSKFGNIFTRNILSVTSGLNISDTQTGLRVVPSKYFYEFEKIEGERFEFEMNMLLFAKEEAIPIYEVPISTIYIEKNETSHFDPIKDSIRIYFVFLKFIFASLTSFFIDIICFSFLIFILNGKQFDTILLSSGIARLLSSIYNYFINQKIVFKKSKLTNLLKYFILVVLQIIVSSVLVSIATNLFSQTNITLLKIIVDSALFFISYKIQKHFVFKE